ncbi:hypothetical protein HHI36_005989, partial [Cryptolaemus montrouzieri]
KDLERHIADYNFIFERLLTVTLMIYGLETVVVGVYAPTDESTLATKDTFYSQFSDVLARIKPHQEILVLGDINARVGSRDDSKLSKLKINDHRLVTAKLVVPYQTSRSGTRTGLVPEEQGTSITLQQEGIKHLYQRRLDSALANAPPTVDIEEEYSNIKWLSDKTNVNWERYKAKNRKARQAIKEQKNQNQNKCQEVESLIGGARSTEVWGTIKQMKTNQTDRFNESISME